MIIQNKEQSDAAIKKFMELTGFKDSEYFKDAKVLVLEYENVSTHFIKIIFEKNNKVFWICEEVEKYPYCGKTVDIYLEQNNLMITKKMYWDVLISEDILTLTKKVNGYNNFNFLKKISEDTKVLLKNIKDLNLFKDPTALLNKGIFLNKEEYQYLKAYELNNKLKHNIEKIKDKVITTNIKRKM